MRRGFDPTRLEVAAEPTGIQFDLEPSGDRAFKLHVKWPGAGGSDSGVLIFSLDDERYRVPVSVTAQGS